MKKDGTDYSVVRHLGTTSDDGRHPRASVIEGSDGALYGTTYFGGIGLRGTVFKVNKDGSGYEVLHRFDSVEGDGHNPEAPVVEGNDGNLYGTTTSGGTNGLGTVFRLSKDGKDYAVIWRFSGVNESGWLPSAPLIEGDEGTLYGTTQSGGSARRGTVFKLNKDGTGYAVLRSFQGPDGDGGNPQSPLMEGSDGLLYGTTYVGGVSQNGDGGGGVVFSLNKDGSSYKILHMLQSRSSDAQNPWAGLGEAPDGALLGTSYWGGSSNAGAVFKLNKDGTDYSVIVNFHEAEGRNPRATLVSASDGALYGTTSYGGEFGDGSVFRITLPPPPKLSLILEPNRVVRLLGVGTPGVTYLVQGTERLISPDWQALGLGIADAIGEFELSDTNGVNFQSRFYRSAKQ